MPRLAITIAASIAPIPPIAKMSANANAEPPISSFTTNGNSTSAGPRKIR